MTMLRPHLYLPGFLIAASIGAYFWGIKGMMVCGTAFIIYKIWSVVQTLRDQP